MSFTPINQVPDGDLEDRLRGLILSSSQNLSVAQYTPQSSPSINTAQNTPSCSQTKVQDEQKNVTPGLSPSTAGFAQSTPGGKKRLNQAQRRQMSSQLSIPVDSQIGPQGLLAGRGDRGTSPSTGGWSQSTGFASPARNYGPQSARLSHGRQQHQYSPLFANHSPGSPYASQMQFQQVSANMPIQHHAQYGYRQHHAPAPQSAGLMDPNQWRGPEPQFSPQHGGQYSSRPPQNAQLYQPGPYNQRRKPPYGVNADKVALQCLYLDNLIHESVSVVRIDQTEIAEKEIFRGTVEQLCRDAITKFEQENNDVRFDPTSVHLKCFGSMASGFATKASDMDLALLSPHSHPAPDSSESSIPRLLEKCLLENGYGTRLLTRTRVPIIKLCQTPTVRLMSDLLEERAKWESGFAAEEMEDQIAVSTDQTASVGDNEYANDVQGGGSGNETSQKSPEELYYEQLNSFRQKKNQSFGDYYGSAKRLLRNLGGRDIAVAQASDTPEEKKVLIDVCKAFVDGLTDDALKSRLTSYRSLQFTSGTQQDPVRSLSGVYAQIEGENLAMRWDSRPIEESTENQEIHWRQEITKWQTLLNSTRMETSVYNKMVHNSVERLKKIPSLQLLFLEQGQHEDPNQYYSRTAKILVDLGMSDTQNTENHKLRIAISHYISGARSTKARETLELISSRNPHISLESVALRQRALQLADDLEKAMLRNLYGVEYRNDIEKYVGILRDDIMKWHDQRSVKLPLTSTTAAILTKLRSLPDPGQVHKSRDRYSDHLEFRNEDNIGIQCDINFSAQLALHNTKLLRCYSLTDSRVKPLILFVKHWAKVRGINTPYRGTLSSYGYVLVVLHYLTNIATPFVCPNLQHIRRESSAATPFPNEMTAETTCNGCNVQFWRDEQEIASLAQLGQLNHNKDSVGTLLRGFFEYYAFNGPLSTIDNVGFDWMRDVLSLRTRGGLLTKNEKGWTGARTVIETTTEVAPIAQTSVPCTTTAERPKTSDNSQNTAKTPTTPVLPKKIVPKEETKEIRHRYLFAIEDPFELDHNVARTVTHNGIVAIRDEFRRAWKIIKAIGHHSSNDIPPENLLEQVVDTDSKKVALGELMEEIHGVTVVNDAEQRIGIMVNREIVTPVKTSEIM